MFFFPTFFFFSPHLSRPIPFFHFFDEKWLAHLIITEWIVEASFTNGGDRQSVVVCVGAVNCRGQAGLALLKRAGRSRCPGSRAFTGLCLDHHVPFPARRCGPSAVTRALSNLLGPSWRGDAGLSWSGNGGCPKASSRAWASLASRRLQDH